MLITEPTKTEISHKIGRTPSLLTFLLVDTTNPAIPTSNPFPYLSQWISSGFMKSLRLNATMTSYPLTFSSTLNLLLLLPYLTTPSLDLACLGKPVVFQQQIHSKFAVPLCCSWHLSPKCRNLVKYCPVALKFRGETSQGILTRNLKALSVTPF